MDGAKYVTDLTEEDFEVYEDGAKQAITFFSRVQQPIALAVLLDTSASMNERLATAQEAAIGFAKRMRREDVMEVIDFDSQARILQTFTNDVAALEKAIRSTDVNGSTSLYNAIYVSLKELKRAKANIGGGNPAAGHRRAVRRRRHVEPRAYEEVLDLAKRSETAIYAIGLRPSGTYRDRVQGSRVRAQAARRRKPAAAPTSCSRRRSCRRSTSRSPRSSPTSTPSRTRRRTRCATAPGAGSSSG